MANGVNGSGRGIPWRALGWGGAVALLALPFFAMQFTHEVNWTPSDFIFAGLLFAAIGALFELGARACREPTYRFGYALGLLGTFLVIWTNLAVGIVGSEDNPENLWFFGALLVGIVGGAAARLRPGGMSWAMAAVALCLGIAFVVATMSRTDEPHVSHWHELAGTGIFAALFLASSALFRRAARS